MARRQTSESCNKEVRHITGPGFDTRGHAAAEFSISDFPHFGEICRCLGAALFRSDLHSGDRPMIFLHRLGIVLYWVGYVLAVLFAIGSLLIALNGLIFGGPISGAWVFAVLSAVCWIWGRLMKYILTEM